MHYNQSKVKQEISKPNDDKRKARDILVRQYFNELGLCIIDPQRVFFKKHYHH